MTFEQGVVGGYPVLRIAEWRDFSHGFLGAPLDFSSTNCKNSWSKLSGVMVGGGASVGELLLLRQTHSTEYYFVRPRRVELSWSDATREGGGVCESGVVTLGEGDALLSSDAGGCDGVLGVITADCFPVLLRAGRTSLTSPGFVAAVHCGWRGVVGGLLGKVLGRIIESGVPPASIEVAIGPGALSCCYEVKEDLVALIVDRCEGLMIDPTSSSILHRDGKRFAELATLLLAEAQSFGVPPNNIATAGLCTICDHRFFSFRRQQQAAGRQLSYIGV